MSKITIKGSEILDTELNLTNFLEWERKLIKVLNANDMDYVVKHPFPSYYAKDMTPERCRVRYQPNGQEVGSKVDKLSNSMRNLRLITPRESCLRDELHEAQNRIVKANIEKNTPVRNHVNMMVGLFNRIEALGGSIKEPIVIAFMLNYLHTDYERFKMHYLFNKKENTFSELLDMLGKYEIFLGKLKYEPLNVKCSKFKKVNKGKKGKVASS
ncbi:uncharacterized protein [Spinacia oleracea]|uniref:Uncharacterized protein n=1 Tax=Spinacia oleracea TaxID=3562 RepID=A0A9R0K980_SPIOL|nr:uncharacterized protein LOC110801070 [Spinacia oleracea]